MTLGVGIRGDGALRAPSAAPSGADWIPAYAGMTVRGGWLRSVLGMTIRLDGAKRNRAMSLEGRSWEEVRVGGNLPGSSGVVLLR